MAVYSCSIKFELDSRRLHDDEGGKGEEDVL